MVCIGIYRYLNGPTGCLSLIGFFARSLEGYGAEGFYGIRSRGFMCQVYSTYSLHCRFFFGLTNYVSYKVSPNRHYNGGYRYACQPWGCFSCTDAFKAKQHFPCLNLLKQPARVYHRPLVTRKPRHIPCIVRECWTIDSDLSMQTSTTPVFKAPRYVLRNLTHLGIASRNSRRCCE